MHTTHIGSVPLDIKIGDSVLSVTVADVLYVPDCNEAGLISWRQIDMLGRLRIVVEDRIITAQRKSEHSRIFIAELLHGCYQVLPFARLNKIYTTATDMWNQALVHSSTRFCSNTTDIYADGSSLHKRTSEFSALHATNTTANTP